MDELFRLDDAGRRVYRMALFGLPRKNGKSTLAAALALYLAGPDGEASPEVVIAAGSRDQAAIVFNQAREFVEASPALSDWYTAQRYLIRCHDTNGIIKRISADGKLQHGLNPHGIVIDELHAFLTEAQTELYTAMVTSTGAREQPLIVIITTAGHDMESILGQLYRRSLELGDVQRRPGLTIARDEANKFLFWWHGANKDASIDDDQEWMRANPASWITRDDLRMQLHSPAMDDNSFRRLHLNQWTAARDAWLPAGTWQALVSPAEIPEGALVSVGVDVALYHDNTAVVVSHIDAAGSEILRSHVWSANPELPADEYCSDKIDLFAVGDYIRELATRYEVCIVLYDPRFFEAIAQQLADEGLPVAPMHQSSAPMADAYQEFYVAARTGVIRHNGDPILAAHVEGTAAKRTERGWQVSKLRSKKIDACVAACMALYGARRYAMAPTSYVFRLQDDPEQEEG